MVALFAIYEQPKEMALDHPQPHVLSCVVVILEKLYLVVGAMCLWRLHGVFKGLGHAAAAISFKDDNSISQFRHRY